MAPPLPRDASVEERIAFLIFEGGGAKGIAHLGALRAMEDLGYAFVGVGGTSAGAFVAALVASGYRSAELLDPDAPAKNLLSTTGQNPIGLLGAKSWEEFARLRRALPARSGGRTSAAIAHLLWRAPSAIPILSRLLRDRGHFSTDGVRDFVNARIRERLRDLWAAAGLDFKQVPELICFKDLDYTRFVQLRPLKIIATDVAGMKPVLFDAGRTPDAVVADAVAASLAIPLFFHPVRVRERDNQGRLRRYPGLFVDGGLVSNLPFWVFTEEKLALERTLAHNPAVPVVAFTLIDAPAGKAAVTASPTDQAAEPRQAFLPFLVKTVRTAIFGSQSIAQGLLRDFVVVRLETRLGVLGFDAPWTAIRDDYVSGRQCALRRVRVMLGRRPDLIRDWLAELASGVEGLVSAMLAGRSDAAGLRLRACLIEPFGTHSLRVSHAHNMEDDADDRLPLDRSAKRGAAAAFRTRDVQPWTRPAPQAGNQDQMTKYERALLRPGLQSAICIPIFRDGGDWLLTDLQARSEPLGLVCLDSDLAIEAELASDAVVRFVVDKTVLFAPIFDLE